MNQKNWSLLAGLIFFFSFGFEFITGLIGRPINPLESILGAELMGFVVFAMVWVVIWTSGALGYLKKKSPL